MGRTGGCLCGAVRYELSVEPVAFYLCHCTDCRKASGGAYSASARLPRDGVQILSGEVTRFESPGGSGQLVCREFCGRCGSQLFSTSRVRPDGMVVRVGSLDDASGTAPKLHIWTHSALDWAIPDDGAPRLSRGPGQD